MPQTRLDFYQFFFFLLQMLDDNNCLKGWPTHSEICGDHNPLKCYNSIMQTVTIFYFMHKSHKLICYTKCWHYTVNKIEYQSATINHCLIYVDMQTQYLSSAAEQQYKWLLDIISSFLLLFLLHNNYRLRYSMHFLSAFKQNRNSYFFFFLLHPDHIKSHHIKYYHLFLQQKKKLLHMHPTPCTQVHTQPHLKIYNSILISWVTGA